VAATVLVTAARAIAVVIVGVLVSILVTRYLFLLPSLVLRLLLVVLVLLLFLVFLPLLRLLPGAAAVVVLP
jgi:hypothetical protein